MSLPSSEVKQIAAQLLAGMLANPHIYHVYPTVSKTLTIQSNSDRRTIVNHLSNEGI